MKNRKKLATVLIGLSLLFAFSFVNQDNKYFYIAKNLDIFSTLFKELNTHYVDSINPKILIERGIEGMLNSLDPYGDYIATENVAYFNTQTTGQYAGIGALIGTVNGKVVILDLYEKFPACKAGLKIGDEILSIDGIDVQNKPISDVSRQLQGKLQTRITLLIKRQGLAKNTQFSFIRENIKLSSITYKGMMPYHIGYIRLDDFRSGSGREVEKTVMALKQQGAEKFIIDLRNNPGGLIYEAINVVSIFVPKGLEIVSVKGRVGEWNRSYTSLNNPVDVDIPVAVLINQASASASEVVAGALQDYDRAVLVGQQTFGKGLVQISRLLPHDAQLKITTAKYYTPSGRCIQVIDYASSQEPNTVDSLLHDLPGTEYLTRGGRKVYEGRGVTPDIKIKIKLLSPLTVKLIASGQLFDYATTFCASHTQPASFVDIKLSEIDYNEFITWLKQKNFFSPSELDEHMNNVIEVAKKERIYNEIQTPLIALQRATEQNQMTGMMKFKDEIISKLKEEIAFHYGLVDSPIEATLTEDVGVREAIKILNDSIIYKKLLTPS